MRKRLLSTVLALCMIVTMIPVTAFAAAGQADPVFGGINGYVATMQADGSTSEGWEDAFEVDKSASGAVEIDNTMRSAALNGKVWADKSVAMDDESKEFDVTLSALGQTFASQESSTTQRAFDVVFVVDVSNSMGYKIDSPGDYAGYPNDPSKSRMAATVDALNTAADVLLDDNNNNRIAVVPFSGSVNSNNIIPLANYQKLGNNSFFEHRVNWNERSAGFKFQANGISKEVSLSGSTNPQEGILEAKDILTEAETPEGTGNIPRTPVIILLTDGEPTTYDVNFTGENSSPDASGVDYSARRYYYTICSAAYTKDQVQEHYQTLPASSSSTAMFFTIGLGLAKNTNAAVMLDPSTSDNGSTSALHNAISQNPAGGMGFSTYNYADKSYANILDSEELKKTFEDIMSSLGDLGVSTEVGESVGGRDKITIYDTLGEGVRFTGSMTLKVPHYTIENNQVSAGTTGNYTLTAYAATEANGVAANTLMSEVDDGPAYLAAGGVVEFRPADEDKEALTGFSAKVQMLSSGKRQLQVTIPPELMAYNVFVSTQQDGDTKYDYFENSDGPLQLTYGVQMREDMDAGSYLVGAPAETYVEFYPSSAQLDDGSYVMPYYWNSSFNNDSQDKAVAAGSDTKVSGSSDYVYSATKGSNNNVRIYLGNNGLYTLTGKTMSLTVEWDDTKDQDGLRPDNVKLQLYVDKTGGDSVSSLTAVGEPVTLPAANGTAGGNDTLTYTFPDLQVYYDGNGAVAKYYVAFLNENGDLISLADSKIFDGYTYSIENQASGAAQKENYFLFDGYADDQAALTGNLQLKLTHAQETVNYMVEKKWDGGEGTSATMQLLADGVEATEEQLGVQPGSVTLTGTTDNWTHTWNNLPKYKDGKEIVYRAAETAYEGSGGVYYQMSYEYESGKTTVTNTAQNAEAAKMNFSGEVIWDDADNQDNVRPQSVTIKLKATYGDSDTPVADDYLGVTTTQEVTGPNWTFGWKNLPRFTSDNQQITYSIVEMKDKTELAQNAELDDNYNVASYNAHGDGYMTVTNTHTPATVYITIKKTWVDGGNQDGIRPTGGVSGVLYKKVGTSGTITALRSYAISGESVKISGLPQYENGKAITYYVSENEVKGYKLSVKDVTADTVNGVNVYPISGNEITLINTHQVQTVDYTVKLSWNDNNNAAGKRPKTVTVNLGNGYSVTLNVNGDNFAVDSTTLPNGASAQWNSTDGLKITDLPQFVAGAQQTYQGSVDAPDSYTATITDFGPNSVSYQLSYNGPTTYDSLGFTKAWVNYTDNGYDMRPSTSQYAQYLTLQSKTDSTSWTKVESAQPVISRSGDNYTVTYSGLNRYSSGQEIQYRVVESEVPNFETTNDTVALKESEYNTLTNTFKLTPGDGGNTYDKITVTKQWVDADAPDNARPTYSAGQEDPLNIKLYRDTDGTHANGIAPSSITVQDDTWTYTWNAGTVLKTDKDGTSPIDYVAYEGAVPANYTATTQSVAVTENGVIQQNPSIVNTYTGAAQTGSLTIQKEWVGDADYTDQRPSKVEFIITGTYEGGTTTNTAEITVSDNNSTTVNNLPQTINGKQVTYTVEEINVPAGYTATYNGNGVALDTDTKTIKVTNTYTPDTWTLTYNANGGENAPEDNTNYSKTNATANVLDKGKMTYTGYTFLGWSTDIHGVVTSDDNKPDDLYQKDDSFTLTGNATLYAVWAVDSNKDGTPDYEQKQVTVNVVWDDDGNRCGIRPNAISFELKDNTYTVDLTDTSGVLVTTNEGNTKWIYTVPDLFGKDASFDEYTLSDVTVQAKKHADASDNDGYANAIAWDTSKNAYTITLTHTPETTMHDVTKTWDFGSASFTTGTATIQLLGNGKEVTKDASGQAVNPITFVPNGSKELKWENLPKYEGGKLITYHAVETKVLDDQGKDVSRHFQVKYDWSKTGETHITNTYSELRDITLLYTWDDDNNAAGERPSNVTVQLYYTIGQDTTVHKADVKQKTISEAEKWSVTWNDLRMYAEAAPDTLMQYEAHVIAYTDANGSHSVNLGDNANELTGSSYSFDIMTFGVDSVFVLNSAMDNETSFTVTKQWNDANNAYQTRPDTVWINLLQDGTVYQSAEVKKDANWTHTWDKLPKTVGGKDYSYTVSEIPVAGYTPAVSGNTITNTLDALTPGTPGNQLTVTFVPNNGEQNTFQTVTYGEKATSFTPTWAEHAFKGWYTDDGTFANLYDFTQSVTQDITLYAKWVSVHDGKEDPDDHHFLTFVFENTSAVDASGNKIDTSTTKIKVSCKSDYKFTASANNGYILQTPSAVGSTSLVSNGNNVFTLENITSDVTVTIKATAQSTGGGGGGGGSAAAKPELEKGDHFAYIIGYPDGTVRPQGDITRAEVATIFFRLLTDESREAFYAATNPYSDVPNDVWYNNAVSTLSNAGIVSGYPDGTFRPNDPITRAELAAIASRFDDLSGGTSRLSDIAGHWAEDLINSAYNKGWVGGYPDGTFRPDQNITRAEVMTLVNRVLERAVKIDGMLDDMVKWSDNTPDSWYYEAVQEATNSHDYSREDGEEYETWTEITPPRDWSELEK